MASNVYLLGDSIRMGYSPFVRELLRDRAVLYEPGENGRWAAYTLNYLVKHQWLKDLPERFSVIHWNNGIWDMNSRHEEDGPFSSVEYYSDCLRKIIRTLRKLTDNIIFAVSTPPREDNYLSPVYHRCLLSLETTIRYNDAALAVMRDEGIEVNDLFGLVFSNRKRFIGDDNTHLTEEGYRVCAGQVVEKISRFL
jgi:lysophospholipase L1-like esterase